MPAHNLAERQILKAQADGVFDRLEGAGKPLPERPPEDAVGIAMRIMAQAGVVPREFELKKEVDAQRARLAAITDPAARKQAMAVLTNLQLRYDIEREARRRFYR
ncbi:DUF1992 domain-containing protein [Roseicyclus persicicus]|uniref:DUF1992 domain-containing protein n=1 Tax=Roseicyclus persicicus TaxID=2650661 RepID=A0A7X6JXB9_9RHOB|nr:DUF1992 domain-containing protein [Roseibacterium persicicum]NKX44640.1 DUF1992 domain-containing protein [Roseibacterium persicicum]